MLVVPKHSMLPCQIYGLSASYAGEVIIIKCGITIHAVHITVFLVLQKIESWSPLINLSRIRLNTYEESSWLKADINDRNKYPSICECNNMSLTLIPASEIYQVQAKVIISHAIVGWDYLPLPLIRLLAHKSSVVEATHCYVCNIRGHSGSEATVGRTADT